MNNSFLTAAASYYGLSPDNVAYSDWANDNGEMVVTFAVRPTDDDVMGILSRMKAMREEEAQRQREVKLEPEISSDDLRKEYNALSPHDRSKYGAFRVYANYRINGMAPVTSNADDFGGLPG